MIYLPAAYWILLRIFSLEIIGASPPTPPRNVLVQRQNETFVVTWDVPVNAYGLISQYVVTSVLLPEGNQTLYRLPANNPIAFIRFLEHLGKLYKIFVQAENQNGLSPQSRSSYIRAPCGFKIFIFPGMTETIKSPNYPEHFEPGIICQWQISTNNTHSLLLHFESMDLGNNCTQATLNINSDGTNKDPCNETDSIRLSDSIAKVTFRSRMTNLKSKGFRLKITTKVKAPNAPSNVTLETNSHSILINWKPPNGEYLPISSYVIKYNFLPNENRIIPLSSQVEWFSINTDGYEGRLVSIQIYAKLNELKGKVAGPFFVRAMCQKTIDILPGRIFNITSPGYPEAYPPGIVCKWTIRNILRSTVILFIRWLDIQQSLLCRDDFIQMNINGNIRECGVMRQRALRTNISTVNIKMKTDYDIQKRGFVIQIHYESNQLSSTISKESTTEQNSLLSTISTDVDVQQTKFSTTQAFDTSLHTLSLPTSLSINNSSPSHGPSSLTIFRHTSSIPYYPSSSTVGHTLASEGYHFPHHERYTTVYTKRQTEKRSGAPSLSTLILSYISTKKTTVFSLSNAVTQPSIIASMENTKVSTPSIYSSTGLHPITQLSTLRTNIDEDLLYYEPNLDNTTIPVHIVIALKRGTTPKKTKYFGIDRHKLRTKLDGMFSDTVMFSSLSVSNIRYKNAKLLVSITLSYSAVSIFKMANTNYSFSLITFVNNTLEDLAQTQMNINGWKIDKEQLAQFQHSLTFTRQRLGPKCKYVVACDQNYQCVENREASCGVLCCKADLVRCSKNCSITNTTSICTSTTAANAMSSSRIDGELMLAVVLSLVIILVIVFLTIFVVIKFQKAKRHKTVQVENHVERIELHDILQSRYIGDKNIEFTAFALKPDSVRGKRTTWSLPSRNILEKCKICDISNENTQGLSTFIEDKHKLKTRFDTRNRLKRQSSL